VQNIEAQGFVMHAARSIREAAEVLGSAGDQVVIVTELALADGNWRDLVERIRDMDISVPVVLSTSSSTPELWWDALECGIVDIVPETLIAPRLFQLFSAGDTSSDQS
jgi:DNA-binding NtrC family response regulator